MYEERRLKLHDTDSTEFDGRMLHTTPEQNYQKKNNLKGLAKKPVEEIKQNNMNNLINPKEGRKGAT